MQGRDTTETDRVGLSIVGGTGYGAAEALRICALHPQIDVISVISASNPGASIADFHPHLQAAYSGVFSGEIDFSALAQYPKRAVLLALPHGTAAEYARSIRSQMQEIGAVLFDLSGDFRLGEQTVRDRFYPGVPSEEQERVVYGLPELNRAAIRTAQELSTPGCLASVTTLAALPLFRAGLPVRGLVVADAKTGTSGAGRALAQTYHHPARHDNANAYKVLEHRHEPEILQNWTLAGAGGAKSTANELSLMFVPHVLSCSRGCMATVYCELRDPVDQDRLRSLFAEQYGNEPFIRLREQAPQLAHVVGSNYCDVAVFARGRQVVAIAAFDNLVKGAAGQAIQNLNLRFGLEERLGLQSLSLGPSAP